MEELRYQRLEEIQVESKMLESVAFKPTRSPIIIGVFGVAALFVNNWWLRILGIIFIVYASIVLFSVKDKKTIDIYETGMIIYNPKDSEYAYWLDYENVEEWDITHESGHDSVIFTLIDKNRAVVDTFQTNKIYNALDKVIPQKNHLAVMAEKNKKLNINPIDALRNLMNRK